MARYDFTQSVLLFALISLFLFFAFCRGALVGESVAIDAATSMGFSDVRVVDTAWVAVGFRGCSEADAVRFTVVGKNPAGVSAKVYVCAGLIFRAATIRTP